jgi:hypothetical protein
MIEYNEMTKPLDAVTSTGILRNMSFPQQSIVPERRM